MKYCPRCITPCNRPNIRIEDDGTCNCATAEEKRTIDWDARREEWAALVAAAKARAAPYDCVVPVSGGKDSTWQVLTALESGMKPLAVTWRPPGRNDLGARNLRNLIDLGVDHFDVSVNPEVEKRFMVETLKRVGSTATPMHMAIFAIPTRIAVQFGIPLVVWGENSAFEYGGEEELRFAGRMNREWLKRYGVTFGTTAEDWVGESLSARDLELYRWFTDDELAAAGVDPVFLGYFFPWDPQAVYERAKAAGFEPGAAPRTGTYDYADLDDDFLSIHHWIKWLKFGFTRVFDNLSLEIRSGRLSRERAVEIVRELGDQTPHEDIRRFCAYTGLPEAEFWAIVERFRNHDVWTRRADGTWMIEDFLVPDWDWQAGGPPARVTLESKPLPAEASAEARRA